jgi:O-acetyl-ADP-ribose deacetylase
MGPNILTAPVRADALSYLPQDKSGFDNAESTLRYGFQGALTALPARAYASLGVSNCGSRVPGGLGFFAAGRSQEYSSPMSQSEILKTFLSGRVTVVRGDITAQKVDAIVNAANVTLLGGGGVDGAIHFKGGPQILEACREIRRTRFPNGLPSGEAVLTTAGNLPARYVIHTVGPITRIGQRPDSVMLAACYRTSLALAAENGLRTIALPAISTGAFGYPPELAAPVVSVAIESVLGGNAQLDEVLLVFYEADDAKLFLQYQKFSNR